MIMEVYVGRQPIFNVQKEVVGYELLCRDQAANSYEKRDNDAATEDVIMKSLLVIGLDALTGGKRAFIKFAPNLLKQEIVTILPAEKVAIELLGIVDPEEDIVAVCRRLKEKGYMMVLDDFLVNPKWMPIIDLADIIKVDFKTTPSEIRRNLVEQLGSGGIQFLAEKVETDAEFQEALGVGYAYFQGFFFNHPTIISGKNLEGDKLRYVKIMREVFNPDFSIAEIEKIIIHDATLSYKLLMFINSAAVGLKNKIKSIRHALTLMGQKEIYKWISLLMLREFAVDKPAELLTSSVIRAKFAEGIAIDGGLPQQAPNAFLVGMLSLIDILLEQPMETIVERLALDDEIASALLGRSNELKNILELTVAFEQGNWELVHTLSQRFSLKAVHLNSLYWDAVRWEKVNE